MEISFNNNRASSENELVIMMAKKKVNADEEIVRHELVKVWTKILEKYAHPGAQIPSAEAIRRELIEKGVNAAAKAVAKEHWFVFTGMVRNEIQGKVEAGLNNIDFGQLIDDVKLAQNDPAVLNYLRGELKNCVLFG